MRLSCREAALEQFVRRTVDEVRRKKCAVIRLDPRGRLSPEGLAVRAEKMGLAPRWIGNDRVLLVVVE